MVRLIYFGGTILLLVGQIDSSFAYSSFSNSSITLARSGLKNGCMDKGYFCSTDCSKVHNCIRTGSEFDEMIAEECDTGNGYYCSSTLGTCSKSFSSMCTPQGYKFACTSVGTFPDPYDCAGYYICYGTGGNLHSSFQQCEVGWLYDVGKSSCLIPGKICTEDPVPSCKNVSQLGALPQDQNLYYICERGLNNAGNFLYPVLYSCPHGGIFETETNSCTTELSTTMSTTTIGENTTMKTTISHISSTADNNPICNSAGAIADLNDCYSYYQCSEDLQQTHKTCENGYYFNDVYQNCVFGTCSNTNGNNNSPTNQPSQTTTNVTPAPGVTTTTLGSGIQTTTTKPSQAAPSCTSEGAIEDPNDCYSYYQCSEDLQQTHKTCENGYYFNDVYQNCVFGTCSNTNGNNNSPTNQPSQTTTNVTPAPGVTTTTLGSGIQTTTTKPSQATPTCTSEGAIEDPNDCYSYYQCSEDLQQTHKTCENGYYFNDVYQNCVFGTCSNTNGNNNSPTNQPSQTTTNVTPAPGVTTTTLGSGIQTTTTKPSQAAPSCTSEGAIEDPNDCYSYYQCSEDLQQTHKTCENGYYFNDVYQNCVFGTCSNTNGNNNSPTNQPSQTTTNVTPAPGVTTTTLGSGIQTTTTKPSQAAPTCTSEGAIEDPNDCYSYYQCSEDLQQTHKTCENGYYFNDVYQNCVFGTCSNTNGNNNSPTNQPSQTTNNVTPAPGVTTTTLGSGIQTTTTKPSQATPTCTSEGAIEDPNDCYSYYQCSEDLQQTHKTCENGYYFNDVYQNCVFGTCSNTNGNNNSPTNQPSQTTTNVTPAPGVTTTTLGSGIQTTTTKPSQTAPSCTSEGAIEDPNDCYSYYQCSEDLQQTHKTCENGYYFNDVYQNCVFGTCSNTNGNNNSPTNQPSQTTTNVTPAPGVTTTTLGSGIQTTTTKPSQAAPSCTSEGAIEDPNDCYSYYQCSEDLQQTHKTCENGYYFNDVYQNCVFGTCSNTNGNNNSPTNQPSQTTNNVTPAPGVTTTTLGSGIQTTTTKPSQATPTCTSEGAIEDPNDCYSYYQCSQDLQQTHKTCENGYYFNDVYKNCVFGTCLSRNGISQIRNLHLNIFDDNDLYSVHFGIFGLYTKSSCINITKTVTKCITECDLTHRSGIFAYCDCIEHLKQTYIKYGNDRNFKSSYKKNVVGIFSNTHSNNIKTIIYVILLSNGSIPFAFTANNAGYFLLRASRSSQSNAKCTVVGEIVDPDDCYSYYECSEDLQPTHKTCGNGYYFSATYQKCVFGTCSRPSGNDNSSSSQTTNNVTPTPITTTTSGSNAQTTKTSQIPTKCTAAGNIEDPNDCYSYYECSEDLQPTHKTCANGYYFSVTYQKCVFGTCSRPSGNDNSSSSQTTNNVTPTPITTTTSGSNAQTTKPSQIPTKCTVAGNIEDLNDCYSYYECSEDLQPTHKTCGNGYYFSVTYQKCVFGTCSQPSGNDHPSPSQSTDNVTPPSFITTTNSGSIIKTTKPSYIPPICTVVEDIEDPNDCYSYYECSEDLQPTHKTCANGYYFSATYQKCVFGTCSRPSGDDNSSSSQTTNNVTPTPITTTTSGSNAQTTKPSQIPTKCTVAGNIEDLNDCYSYYECLEDLQPTHKTCGNGYYFSVTYHKCVFGTC